MQLSKVQYISDEKGKPTGVLVPIALWRKIEAAAQSERKPDRAAEDAADLRAARRARTEAQKKGAIGWEQIKQELGL